MIDLSKTYAANKEDLDSVSAWCSEYYSQNFAKYFQKQRDLYSRMKSDRKPITDEELEVILTEIPLEVFTASEMIGKLKVNQETMKIAIRKKAAKIAQESMELSETKRKEEAANSVLDDELLKYSFGVIIERVDREISYSRELIMGAKKIWDSRRSTESSNPVGEVLPPSKDSLPDYRPNQYIK